MNTDYICFGKYFISSERASGCACRQASLAAEEGAGGVVAAIARQVQMAWVGKSTWVVVMGEDRQAALADASHKSGRVIYL